MLKVFKACTASLTWRTFSPERMMKASAACTAITAAIAFALSGRPAVP
jgi:hypothetical protein